MGFFKNARNAVCVLALLGLFVTGCTQIVHVEDLAGSPIEGALITTQYSRMQPVRGAGPSGTTNRFGDAMLSIPSIDNSPLWMTITKPGYLSRAIAYTNESRIVVKLQPLTLEQVPAE